MTSPGPVVVDACWLDPACPLEPPPGTELGGEAGAGLRLATTPALGVAGAPLLGEPLHDAVLTVELGLAEGDDQDLGGLYVRQSTSGRYLAFMVSPTGRVLVIERDPDRKDAEVLARLDAPLLPTMPFEAGIGGRNRLSLVLAGPALSFYVNGAPVTPLLVDQRFADGFAGYYLRPGGTSARCVLDVASTHAVRLFTEP
ncbi:MAG: hypothetical protein ABIY58_00995 [Acidimicrobiales bacterium]